MHIVGTAGHVDHGKSSLVAALTGTNPDRWLEEQLRGMTLDLGFAHLVLDGGIEAGIVDVPGHERFLHNMLAGAAGMDVLLLVVAANEGVRPQTVEHLQILQYLNVRATVVALTKIDVVPREQLGSIRDRIAADLRETIAHGAPLVGVSSRSGEGLEALRAEIARALRALPPRDADAPVYLPVDRVFTLAGLGTIVTGTLMQGSIGAGDVLALLPSGLDARVRSLHVFGASRTRADAGSRVALNLSGVDRHAIARGESVVSPQFAARADLSVRFTPLPGALPLLRRRTPVRAYVGSAEILGTLAMEEVPVDAGEIRAELRLRSPVAAFPGVRFVVRRPSPKTLLGGGYVEKLAIAAPAVERPGVEELVLAALSGRGLEPVDAVAVAQAANLREETTAATLETLSERGEVLQLRRPVAFVERATARALLDRTVEVLESAHRAEPWGMGATSIALSRALAVPEPLLVRYLAAFVEAGELVARAGYYAAVDHRPHFTAEQLALFDRVVPRGPAPASLPASFEAVAAEVKRSPAAGAVKAFDTLLTRGAFVKIGDDLYRGSQIAEICARVEEYLRRNEQMTAAEFRDLLGTSRKYAMPLLEWLDARGVTLRNGDYRTLRKRDA